MPVAYHGRASSVVVSGGAQPRRPFGQLPPVTSAGAPSFGPTAQLDFELELGFILGFFLSLGLLLRFFFVFF